MNHNLRSRVPNKRTFGFDLRDRTQVAQYEASKGRADVSSSSNQSATNSNNSMFGLGNVASGLTGGILKSANKQMRMRQAERVHFKDGEPDMCRISEGTERSPMVKSVTPKRQALLTPKKVAQSTPCKTSDPLKRKRPVSTPKHQKAEQPILCIDQYLADLSTSHISVGHYRQLTVFSPMAWPQWRYKKLSLAQLLSLKTIIDDEIQKKSEETENLGDNRTPENVNTQSDQASVEIEKNYVYSEEIPVVSGVPELCMEIDQEEMPTKEYKKENHDLITNGESDNPISIK